eukprot:jgi/Bigna1/134140/aug1.24_g8848
MGADDYSEEDDDLALLAKLKENEGDSDNDGDTEKSKPATKKNKIDVLGLESKLRDIKLPEQFHWVESLAVTSTKPLELEDVHDDLKREAAFYTESLKAAKICLKNLKQMNIPFERPEDFYAEMVKTDAHMAKVKAKLLVERKKMDATANRIKEKEAGKYVKQVPFKRLQAKAKRKRKELEDIKKMGSSGESNEKMQMGWLSSKDGTNTRGGGGRGGQGRKSKKRELADKKFGFGGKKKRYRSNTAESSADMSGWDPTVNSNKKRNNKPGGGGNTSNKKRRGNKKGQGRSTRK